MTEFEINKKVAQKLGLEFKCSKSLDYITVCGTPFDPCNDAEQAWEIMMKYNICVTKVDDVYEAYLNLSIDNNWNADAHDIYTHKKPFVATMLLFLEV